MYFRKEWGKGMGLKSFVSFGSESSRKVGGKKRYRKMLMLRVWLPWFPLRALPWRFDEFKYIWVDLEEEDIVLG